jgi:hypothetical protein
MNVGLGIACRGRRPTPSRRRHGGIGGRHQIVLHLAGGGDQQLEEIGDEVRR